MGALFERHGVAAMFGVEKFLLGSQNEIETVITS